jgi:hypothetical protein
MFRFISQFAIKRPILCTIMTASGIYGASTYSQLGKTRVERCVKYRELYGGGSGALHVPMMLLMPPIMIPLFIGENIRHNINCCFVSNDDIKIYYKKRNYLRHISTYKCENKCINHDIDDRYRCINSECDCSLCGRCGKKSSQCVCRRGTRNPQISFF